VTVELLVTGATGFVGGRVAAAARARPGVRVRTLSRRAADGRPADGRPTDGRPTDGRPTDVAPADVGPDAGTVPGDLADPRTLHGSCAGVDVLVHCASRVGGDPDSVAAVNDAGTKALVWRRRYGAGCAGSCT